MKKIVNTIDFNDVPEATKILTDHWNLVSVPPIRELVFSEMSTAIAYISSASLRVDKDFFDASPLLKVIASPSTGKDHIDMKLLESRDIVLLDISKEFELLD